MIKFKVKVMLAVRDMTQKELAEKTGIRPPTISAICLGTIKQLPIEGLNKICKALDCQPSDLMEYVEDLREHRKISSPILFVPSGVNKHDVEKPNGKLLIDDSKTNIRLWIENGGKGFIFDKTISEDTNSKVKSLEFLLKR